MIQRDATYKFAVAKVLDAVQQEIPEKQRQHEAARDDLRALKVTLDQATKLYAQAEYGASPDKEEAQRWQASTIRLAGRVEDAEEQKSKTLGRIHTLLEVERFLKAELEHVA